MAGPALELDHIVITCHRLEAGMDYIERTFGVSIPPGGQHDFMGTHNAVMAVGRDAYLEVIAIDPSLPAPPYPRWFGLGNIQMEDRLKDKPMLAHFVLRTTDLEATLAGLEKSDQALIGKPQAASRGDLRWQITLNPTGLPPMGGCLPALIEWDGTPPISRMAFPGPVLDKLRLGTPEPERLRQVLTTLGGENLLADGLLDIETATPAGLKADFTHRNRSIWI
ncbi:MAG: VOC family protein [Candidatus Puniceispirillales bacterium]